MLADNATKDDEVGISISVRNTGSVASAVTVQVGTPLTTLSLFC